MSTPWSQLMMTAETAAQFTPLKEKTMFFTPIAPAIYRTNARLGLERFLQEVARPQHTPPTQFEQDELEYRLSMDMPGVSRDHLAVQIEEQMVQINTTADAKRVYKAQFELPLPVDAASSSAKLENGILSLVLVKKMPQSKAQALLVQ
jgi:HSP20 family molecular chaperone IbpA